MSVLILKNIATEGPGTIGDYLRERGIASRVVELSMEPIPSAEGVQTLILLGGPMSVNDENEYPYLLQEEELVRKFIAEGKKVLGICLGAQLIAKALGSRVYPGPEKEIGWYDIELLGEGIRDRLMQKLAIHPRAGDYWRKFRVFHWHGETFDIPEGGERLARSARYENQAFRIGTGVYAFQFHIEVSRNMIDEWMRSEKIDISKINRDTEMFYNDYCGRALNFYEEFFSDHPQGGDK